MLWLLAAALLLIAWLGWQLSAPVRPFASCSSHDPHHRAALPDRTAGLRTLARQDASTASRPKTTPLSCCGRSMDWARTSTTSTADDWQVLDRELGLGPDAGRRSSAGLDL